MGGFLLNHSICRPNKLLLVRPTPYPLRFKSVPGPNGGGSYQTRTIFSVVFISIKEKETKGRKRTSDVLAMVEQSSVRLCCHRRRQEPEREDRHSNATVCLGKSVMSDVDWSSLDSKIQHEKKIKPIGSFSLVF